MHCKKMNKIWSIVYWTNICQWSRETCFPFKLSVVKSYFYIVIYENRTVYAKWNEDLLEVEFSYRLYNSLCASLDIRM